MDTFEQLEATLEFLHGYVDAQLVQESAAAEQDWVPDEEELELRLVAL